MLSLIPGLYQVPQGHAVIIERFGKYEKTLAPGLNFVNPLVYGHKNLSEWRGTASKCNYLMELTEQQFETNARKCQTKDNVTVEATAVVYFKITDPSKAIYSVDVLPKALQDMCLNVLRSKVGSYGFDELFSKRGEISSKVTGELEEKVKSWGIDLGGVEIGKLDYDREIYNALQKKRIAEAEKDAKITSAESASLTAIKEAETELRKSMIGIKIKENEAKAEAEMLQIRAAGKAKALEIEAQANSKVKDLENKSIEDLAKKVGREAAVKLTTASKAVQGFENLAMNSNHKVVLLPNEFKGMVKLVGGDALNP
jgi:regulator of protease activity HflC (stomatin/prohibitin superfamily)